jgi:hypothetical protein
VKPARLAAGNVTWPAPMVILFATARRLRRRPASRGGGRGSRWPAGRQLPSSRAGCTPQGATGRDPAVEATGGIPAIRTYVRVKCEEGIY